MGQFYDDYKDGRGAKGHKEAYNFIVNDLMQFSSKGDSKQRSITAYNMEKDAMVNFAPSMFYVFLYNNPTAKEGSVIDYVPMILCTGFSKKTVTGINFNLLPNDVRALVIDVILESYPNFYTEKNLRSSNFVLNEKFAAGLIGGGASAIVKAIKMKTKYDISSAVRTYDCRFIMRTRMLEYDMWQYIPLLCFRDSVRGIKLATEQLQVAHKNK